MKTSRVTIQAGRLFEQSVLTTDVARALRSSLVMAAAWTVCLLTGHGMAAMVVAPTAQNVAMVDVRGDYRSRLVILLALTLVMAMSVFAGTVTGDNALAATLTIGALALLAGFWRHYSGDYGPNFALASALVFFIALSQPGDWRHGMWLMGLTALAGLGGILVQISGWFVRPQHALRHAVAEAWVAASDLITELRAQTDDGQPRLSDQAEKEAALRATVDRTLHALAASSKRSPGFVAHLDNTTQLAARLATRTTAFHTALEALKSRPDFATIAPTVDSVLRAMASLLRSAALTVITHRPEQLVALEVRLRRETDLVRVLDGRLAALGPTDGDVTLVRELLAQVKELLPIVRATLTETVDQGAAHSGFALRLPELGDMSVRALSSWLNPPAQMDWVLLRYTLRVTALMMLAVAAYLTFDIPRGYWIAFTALVVLQPDYGATRLKAGQRILGTLAGSGLGSLLLWVKMPVGWHVFFAAVLAFGFAFYVRRNYGLAVFFVTLMIVLMTEVMTPLHLDFTVARLLCTLAGGALALLAAVMFWPKWERSQSPRIIAAAVRANRKYLAAVTNGLARGEPFAGDAVLMKREAERANSQATASLQRLLGEPPRLQHNVEQVAALTADNQRLTRAITVLAQQLNRRFAVTTPGFASAVTAIGHCMETLAENLEAGRPASLCARPDLSCPADQPAHVQQVYGLLTKVVTEIEAMALAAGAVEPERAQDEGRRED